MIDWLIRSTFEFTVIVGLLLLINPLVRRVFSAQIAYWLWVIPLIAVVLWENPPRPAAIEVVPLPNGGALMQMASNSSMWETIGQYHLEWVWLVGVVFFALLKLFLWFKYTIELKRYSTSTKLTKALGESLSEQKLSKSARYFLTSLPIAPCVTGLVKPKIYLPDDFFEKFSHEEQAWILIHEHTHLKRLDLWAQLAGEVIKVIFWFNPIIYFAWPRFTEDQEFACDYQSVKNTNSTERAAYGRTLLKDMALDILPVSLAFFPRKKERFIMLQKHKPSIQKTVFGLTFSAVIGLVMLTDPPTSQAETDKSAKLSLNFKEIKLNDVLPLFANFVDKELTGISVDKELVVNVSLNTVPWRSSLMYLLNCHGYGMSTNETSIDIYKLPSDQNLSIKAGCEWLKVQDKIAKSKSEREKTPAEKYLSQVAGEIRGFVEKGDKNDFKKYVNENLVNSNQKLTGVLANNFRYLVENYENIKFSRGSRQGAYQGMLIYQFSGAQSNGKKIIITIATPQEGKQELVYLSISRLDHEFMIPFRFLDQLNVMLGQ